MCVCIMMCEYLHKLKLEVIDAEAFMQIFPMFIYTMLQLNFMCTHYILYVYIQF